MSFLIGDQNKVKDTNQVPISLEQKERLTQKIIDVAERQIANSGIGNLSIRNIATEAGCSSGSLYTRFEDLDELVLTVNSRTLARLDAVLGDASERSKGQSVAFLFNELAQAYLHFALAYKNSFGALFEHQMPNGAPIPEWHLKEHYVLFRYIEAPLITMQPDLDETERRTLARTIYSAVHGIVHMSMQGRLLILPVPIIEDQLRKITKILATGLQVNSNGDVCHFES